MDNNNQNWKITGRLDALIRNPGGGRVWVFQLSGSLIRLDEAKVVQRYRQSKVYVLRETTIRIKRWRYNLCIFIVINQLGLCIAVDKLIVKK